MEAETIIAAISSVGFPIVACCAMFYLIREIITKITQSLEKQSVLMEQQTKSTDKQTETLEKLNVTIGKFEYRLDLLEKDLTDIKDIVSK